MRYKSTVNSNRLLIYEDFIDVKFEQMSDKSIGVDRSLAVNKNRKSKNIG